MPDPPGERDPPTCPPPTLSLSMRCSPRLSMRSFHNTPLVLVLPSHLLLLLQACLLNVLPPDWQFDLVFLYVATTLLTRVRKSQGRACARSATE